jgi:hypothetical protein
MMLGWMLLRAAGGALNQASRSAQQAQAPVIGPAKEEDGSGAWGIVIFALLLPLIVAGVADGYHGHASFAVTSAFIIAFIALTLTGSLVLAAARHSSSGAVLRKYSTPPPPDTTAQGFRQLAAQLREQEAAQDLAAARQDAAEREARVAALFSVRCPVVTCTAPPGLPCSMGIGIPVALVRKNPSAFCHLARMRAAVAAGAATEEDVAAQFGGMIPAAAR